MRGLIPLQVPHQIHDRLAEVRVTESVFSIQELLADKRAGSIVYHFPPEQEAMLMASQEGGIQFRPTRIVGANSLYAILAIVRTTILEWALRLEADGILGENLFFSAIEKQAAMNNFNIQNFQGIIGNIDGGSSVSQTNSQQITTSDFSSLAKCLGESGVSKKDVQELGVALEQDPKPASNTQFGPKVSAWVGKMMGKAASGGWEMSVATAGGFLANAISKYYGLI